LDYYSDKETTPSKHGFEGFFDRWNAQYGVMIQEQNNHLREMLSELKQIIKSLEHL